MARVVVARKSFSSAVPYDDVEADSVVIPTDGVSVTNGDGRSRFLLISAGVALATVVIRTPTLYDTDLTLEDREVIVGNGEMVLIGPFSPLFYNQPDATIHVDPKAAADDNDVKIFPFVT